MPHAARPRYEPWVGDAYDSGDTWGGRALVLGLSHYGGDDVRDADLTRVVVERHLRRGQPANQFFTKVAKRFPGQDDYGSSQSRAAFWQSVAFYNYIQESAGTAPRQAPPDDAVERSWPAFEQVLGSLRPDFILGLGIDLGRQLRPRLASPETLRLDGGRSALLGRLPGAAPGRGLIGFIAHVTSSAMTRRQGQEVVTVLRNKALASGV